MAKTLSKHISEEIWDKFIHKLMIERHTEQYSTVDQKYIDKILEILYNTIGKLKELDE